MAQLWIILEMKKTITNLVVYSALCQYGCPVLYKLSFWNTFFNNMNYI